MASSRSPSQLQHDSASWRRVCAAQSSSYDLKDRFAHTITQTLVCISIHTLSLFMILGHNINMTCRAGLQVSFLRFLHFLHFSSLSFPSLSLRFLQFLSFNNMNNMIMNFAWGSQALLLKCREELHLTRCLRTRRALVRAREEPRSPATCYHARMARRAQHLRCSLCERSERAVDGRYASRISSRLK